MNKKLFCLCFLLSMFLFTAGVYAWVEDVELLAHAQPQECYVDVGVRVDPISTDPFTCPEGSIPHTPQAYTWSMAVVSASQSPAGPGRTGVVRHTVQCPLHNPGGLLQ